MSTNHVIQMADKTVLFVSEDEFNAVGLAMSMGAKTYQLKTVKNEKKNILEDRLINLTNVITMNKTSDIEDEVPNKHDDIFKIALSYELGRMALTESMLPPAQLVVNNSLARKVLIEDPLPPGQIPKYDKKKNVPAFFVILPNKEIEPIVQGSDFIVPTFEIALHATKPLTGITSGSFDSVFECIKEVGEYIKETEETQLFKLLEASLTKNNYYFIQDEDDLISEHTLDEVLQRLFYRADQYTTKYSCIAENILVNPYNVDEFCHLKGFVLATDEESSLSGLYGKYKNINVYFNKLVQRDTLYILPQKHLLGVMPVRNQFTIIPADIPRKRKFGVMGFEVIGMAIIQSDLIVKVEIGND